MTFSLAAPLTAAEMLRAVDAMDDETFLATRFALISGEPMAGSPLRLDSRDGALLFLLVSDHRFVTLAASPLLNAVQAYAEGSNWTDMVWVATVRREVEFTHDELWQGGKHGHTVARAALAEWKERHP